MGGICIEDDHYLYSGQISIQGLLTVETAAQANVCGVNESVADCVLVYNAKIFMNALALVSISLQLS